MSMVEKLNAIKNRKIWNVDEIENILKETTIFDKIEFSGITKQDVKQKIDYLKNQQIPNRTVLKDMDDNVLLECWFKNWLHPMLKHAVNPAPKDKRGCSKKVLEMDIKQDMLHFYENGQQNFDYTIDDIENWLNQ